MRKRAEYMNVGKNSPKHKQWSERTGEIHER